METARSMMFHTNVPKRFWNNVVISACYLINRIPTRILNDISLFKVLNKIKPSLDHLRVFGCLCYIFIPGEHRNKFEAKFQNQSSLDTQQLENDIGIMILLLEKILLSGEVKFMESKMYYEKNN